jgi:AcrR family transcriptional regulator
VVAVGKPLPRLKNAVTAPAVALMSVYSIKMARAKSEDKRNAILDAATTVFAERGLGAATAAISRAAGVAEGTLFTYFKTKDELVNALYREIKLELADAMMSDFPRRASVRERFQHVWDRYVQWGIANPLQHKALQQIMVWGGLTQESRSAGIAPFLEIEKMAQAAVAEHVVLDRPLDFIAATVSALAETTIQFMRRSPGEAEMYRLGGFEMLWAAISRKR